MYRFVNILCIGTALLMAPVLSAHAQAEGPVEAKVSKNKVATGELFTYSLKIKGSFALPKLILPEFSDLRVVSTNQAKNYSFQGNVTLVEVVINCVLVAVKPGVFTIKPAVLEDKNKKFTTAPITIEVTGKPLKEKRKILPYIEKGTEI